MNTIKMTKEFQEWLYKLKNMEAKAHILRRIERAKANNFGDYKMLADNLYEMRIYNGPGYRVYYTQLDSVIYLLLLGGDKSSQTSDIEKAKAMLKLLGERNE